MTGSTISQQVRKQGIAEAVEAAREASRTGQGSSNSIRWRDADHVLPVATVSLDLVLLNPHSHRIKSYVQSLDNEQQALIQSDPFGSEAQSLIEKILAGTEGYGRIKNTLARDGQRDPGLMTSEGVLVNGNTRAVALRDLRREYIKALVLPGTPTSQEIVELELSLQMQADVKQEYSLTGQLLLIEDLIKSGKTTEEVGRAMRRDLTDSAKDKKVAEKYVETELRLLALIRRVMEASSGRLKLTDFDDKRQALIEVDSDYEGRSKQDPQEATRIRDAQLAAMITGIDYRKLRRIDGTLIDEYLLDSLRDRRVIGPHVDSLLQDPADPADDDDTLDLFDGGPATVSNDQPNLSGVYSLLAQTSGVDIITLPAPADGQGSETEIPRTAFEAEVNAAFMDAIQTKEVDDRKVDDLAAPSTHLREAARSLDKAAAAYAEVHGRPEFDHEGFTSRRRELTRALEDFDSVVPE